MTGLDGGQDLPSIHLATLVDVVSADRSGRAIVGHRSRRARGRCRRGSARRWRERGPWLAVREAPIVLVSTYTIRLKAWEKKETYPPYIWPHSLM